MHGGGLVAFVPNSTPHGGSVTASVAGAPDSRLWGRPADRGVPRALGRRDPCCRRPAWSPSRTGTGTERELSAPPLDAPPRIRSTGALPARRGSPGSPARRRLRGRGSDRGRTGARPDRPPAGQSGRVPRARRARPGARESVHRSEPVTYPVRQVRAVDRRDRRPEQVPGHGISWSARPRHDLSEAAGAARPGPTRRTGRRGDQPPAGGSRHSGRGRWAARSRVFRVSSAGSAATRRGRRRAP